MGRSTDMEKLKDLNAKSYKDQAVWFLNGFWSEHETGAEQVWSYVNKMIELDEKSGKDGCELDELCSHRFLEKFEETLTVRELREKLREIDIDTNKMMSLSEYLIFRFKADWHRLVNAAQGDNTEEIEKAQRLLTDAQEKLAIAIAKAEEARKAEVSQKQAEAEVKRTMEALEAEEKAYNDKKSSLERKSQEGGLVARNTAKHQLEQHLAEDPLPLRRAKINQGAAVRASERATAKCEEARKEAEKSLAAAQAAFAEAEAFLNEVKSRGGSGQGVIWWMNRELEEAKKYMPQSRGGTAK